MEQKLTGAIKNTIDSRKFLKIIFHPFYYSHRLPVFILYHRIFLQGFSKHGNLR